VQQAQRVLMEQMGPQALRAQRARKASKASKALRVTLATREPQALIQQSPDRPDLLAHKGTLVQPDQRATRGQPGPLERTAMMAQ